MKKSTISWILALIAAIILFQTLFFKFTAAPESVYIFSALGVEPWGRIGTGILELITGILLIVPASRHWGALLGAGIMGGAIMSHVFVLGIEIQGDGGYLFILGLVVTFCCLWLLWVYREKFQVLFKGQS